MTTEISKTACVTTIADAPTHVRRRIGPTEWQQMTQARVNQFAEVTGDHNFIHVDPARARQTPFGGTIAHGYLTLSLLGPISQQLLVVSDAATSVNYGLNKVRFLSAVTAGSRVRVRSELADAAKVADDTVNLTVRHTVEIEGVDKPAAVAELIARFVW